MPDVLGTCPLCGGDELRILDAVQASAVVDAYAKAFDIDVRHFFSSIANIRLYACERCGMHGYDPMPTGDSVFYERLQQHGWYYQDHKPEYAYAQGQVGPMDRVLEIGCGKGVFRSYLAPEVQYCGPEFNRAAIENARAIGLDVSDESLEVHIARHREAYDVVCHFQVLEHVPAPAAFLSACVEALKPGGKLIIAVPAEDSFLTICEGGWLNMPPHHVTRWPDRTLRYAYEALLGLQVEAIWHEPVADYHQDWHRKVMARRAVNELIGRKSSLAGNTFGARAVGRIAAFRPIEQWLFDRSMRHFAHALHGHTVCIVGRK